MGLYDTINTARNRLVGAATNLDYSQSSMRANMSEMIRAEARVVVLEMIQSGELMQLMTEDARFYEAMVKSAGNTE